MKQCDAYTESQKIEKLLERTLSENFDSQLKWCDLSKYQKESLVRCLVKKILLFNTI